MISYIFNAFEKFKLINTSILGAVPERLDRHDVHLDLEYHEQGVGPVFDLNREEKSDDYSKVIVRLNDEWRVIECKDGIQWILQSRKGSHKGKPAWRARAYCRSKEGLIRRIEEIIGNILDSNLKELYKLPDWI